MPRSNLVSADHSETTQYLAVPFPKLWHLPNIDEGINESCYIPNQSQRFKQLNFPDLGMLLNHRNINDRRNCTHKIY